MACGYVYQPFAIWRPLFQPELMTQPLALVFYEKLLPGSQIVNRLQDLNYRAQAVSDPTFLMECAEQAKPLLVLADLQSGQEEVLRALRGLKQNPATQHLPIIAFALAETPQLRASAVSAGVTLLVSDAAILNHLPQLLDQALQVE